MNRSTFVLFASLSLAVIGCDSSPDRVAGGSTSETRTTVIDIQGKVVSSTGNPIPAIQVRMRRTGLEAVTGEDGRYRLQASRTELPVLDGPVDTIDFLRDGMRIGALPVPAWTARMETAVLVQREISGIVRNLRAGARISAVLGERLADGTVVELESDGLGREAASTGFSGFAWFPYSGLQDTFHLAILVRDSSGRISGFQGVYEFTNRHGNVATAEFDADNLVPHFTLRQLRSDLWGITLEDLARGEADYLEVDSLALARFEGKGRDGKDLRYVDGTIEHFEFRTATSGWKYYEELSACAPPNPTETLMPCRGGDQAFHLGIGKVIPTPALPVPPRWVYLRATGITGQVRVDSFLVWGVEQLGWNRTSLVQASTGNVPTTWFEISVTGQFEIALKGGLWSEHVYRFLLDGKPLGSGAYTRMESVPSGVSSPIALDTLLATECTGRIAPYRILALEVCDSTRQACGISDSAVVLDLRNGACAGGSVVP